MNSNLLLPFEEYLNPACIAHGISHYCYASKNSIIEMYDEADGRQASVISECHGLHLDNIKAVRVSLPPLEKIPFVPVVSGGDKQLFMDYEPSYVAVMLRDILNRSGTHVRPNIRQRLHIPGRTIILGFIQGDDNLLAKFIPNQRRIYQELNSEDIPLLIGPNLSVWENQPLIAQNINRKRNLLSYSLMQEAGLNAVPNFLWKLNDREDIEEIAQWINDNPLAKAISINLQTYQQESYWHRIFADLRMIVGLLNRPLHFVICGPQTYERINQLIHLLGNRFTLVSAEPQRLAWARREVAYSRAKGYHKIVHKRELVGQAQLFDLAQAPQATLSQLFKANCAAYYKMISQHEGYRVKTLEEAGILMHDQVKVFKRKTLGPTPKSIVASQPIHLL